MGSFLSFCPTHIQPAKISSTFSKKQILFPLYKFDEL